jgi:putative endopeptidase
VVGLSIPESLSPRHREPVVSRLNRAKCTSIAVAFLTVFTVSANVTGQDSAKINAGPSANAAKVSGIDLDILSKELKPGEDFYRYSNEKWLNGTQIPADKADYGIFTLLDDKTQQQVRELIESVASESGAASGSAAQKVGDLYRSYIDLESRNAQGIAPIQPLLEVISQVDSLDSLGAAMGKLHRYGIGAPLGLYVSVDARNSDRYITYLTQSGLSLPDRDYYLVDEPQYVKLRQQLSQYAADLLTAVGFENAETMGAAIVEIESAIAKQQWTKTENRDPIKTYNSRTPEELDAMMGPFPWDSFRDAYGLDKAQSMVVRQPTYFDALGKLVGEFSVDQWKAYLAFHAVDAYASGLSEELEKRHFDFHGTAISGIDEQRPLWKRAVGTTGSVLGELVGQLYVEKHFTPRAKERMNELVDNLKRAFAGRIETLEWMGEGTKKQALEKLTQFNTKIGYPDEWKSYDDLSIGSDSLAANLLAAAEFETNRDLAKLGAPIDRNEWHMTPQTINAYYNPTMNEIVFPAAILQPPFFNLEADDAVNYGGIGAVIGHELSHGFDDKGSKFDGKGNLRNWWTEEDRAEFERRAAGLVKQYNAYRPVEDMAINGELTLGENIGDLGGLSVAYAAYRLSLDGKEAPVIDGLTGDQRFFLGWGQIWRRLYRDPELRKRLIVDPHSPSQYRVNGIVRNMDAFYEAFGIRPGDPLYLAPEDRVRIW